MAAVILNSSMRTRAKGLRPASLRGWVLAALLVTGLLPVLGLGSYAFFSERKRAVALELSRLSDQSQRLCVYIDKYLASNATLVQHLALTSEVVSFLAAEHPSAASQRAMNHWLQAQCGLDKDLDAILMTRADGQCVASSEPRFLGANYGFREYFLDAMAGRSRLTDWQIGMRTLEPCVFVSQAVKQKGRVLGVIISRIGMTRIQQEVAARSTEGKVAYLMNRDGIFLAHTRPELVYSAIAPIPGPRLAEIEARRQFMGQAHPVIIKLDPHSIQTVFQVSATGQPAEIRYTSNGVARWVALRRLEEEPWVVGVAVNEGVIYGHSRRILLLTALVCLLMVLLVGLGGFWFSRRILGPLEDLERSMARFGGGDASVRTAEGGRDEVGRLGQQFNVMADTIEHQTQILATRVSTLEGILPICASCRKIRNEEGEYEVMESYISKHSGAQFSHGLCEPCAQKLYPELYRPGGKKNP